MVDMRFRCHCVVLLFSVWLACSSSPVAAAWLGPSTQSHSQTASAAVSAASAGKNSAVESPGKLAGDATPAAAGVSGAAPTAHHRHRSRRLRPDRHSHEHYSSHERKHGGHEHKHDGHERKHDHERKHTHEPHRHHRHQDPTDTPDRTRQEDYHYTSYSHPGSSSYSHPDPSRQEYTPPQRPPYQEPAYEDTEGRGPYLYPHLQGPRAEWRGLPGARPKQPRRSGSDGSSSRRAPPSREQPGGTSPLPEQQQEPEQAGDRQQPQLPSDGNKQPQESQELPNLGAPDFEQEDAWTNTPEQIQQPQQPEQPDSSRQQQQEGKEQNPESPDFEREEVWTWGPDVPPIGDAQVPQQQQQQQQQPPPLQQPQQPQQLQQQQQPNLGAPDFEQEDAWKDTPEQSQEPDSSSREQQQQTGKEQNPESPDFEQEEVWTRGPEDSPAGDAQVPQQQQQQQPPPQQPPAQHQVLDLQPDGTAKQGVSKEPQDKPGQAQQPPVAQEVVEEEEADPAFGDGHGHEKHLPQQPRGFGFGGGGSGYGNGGGYGYGYGYGSVDKQRIESIPGEKNTNSTVQEPEGDDFDPAFGDGHGNSKLPSGSAGDDPDGEEGYGPYDKPKSLKRDPQKRFAADREEEFPDPTALTNPGTESLYGNDTAQQAPGNYGYWPVFKPPGGGATGSETPEGQQDSSADFGGSSLPDSSSGSGGGGWGERRFGEPAPGEEAPKAFNGTCRVGGSESNCQGSGVIIDNSTSAADGAITAIADCVEELGNIYQKGGYCDLVCTDEADYKVVEKSLEKFKTGFDGQVTCEARRVTDSISINGICSLIPVATCCEPDNPDEGIVFAISQAARSRREKKGLKDKRTSYQQ